jgi:hypothetical protein
MSCHQRAIATAKGIASLNPKIKKISTHIKFYPKKPNQLNYDHLLNGNIHLLHLVRFHLLVHICFLQGCPVQSSYIEVNLRDTLL